MRDTPFVPRPPQVRLRAQPPGVRGHMDAVDFSPTQIAGLQLWLKADAITGLADGDPVATWVDSSGNGRDLTQGTPAARPLWKQSIQNGLPVVRCDGSDDYLESASPPTGFHANTLFLVITPRTALATNDGLFAWAATGVNDWDNVNGTGWLEQATNTQTLSDRRVGVNGLVSAPSAVGSLVVGTTGLWCRTMSGSACAYRLNGAVSGVGDTYSDANLMTPTRMGLALRYNPAATLFAQLDYAEVLWYSALLSDPQIVQVETYLKAKWATP